MLDSLLSSLLQAIMDFLPKPESDKGDQTSDKLRPWSWKDIYGIAAVAGVNPDSYTLRELFWMCTTRQMEEWDRVAWICLHIPSFSRSKKSFEDLNPLRASAKRMNLSDLYEWKQELESVLPKTLSEEEVMERIQRLKEE